MVFGCFKSRAGFNPSLWSTLTVALLADELQLLHETLWHLYLRR